MPARTLTLSIGLTALSLWSSSLRAAEPDFARDIRPLLQQKCWKCHGPEKVKGGLRLDSRAATLKGGDDGVAIIPGNSADSPLIHLVEDQDMPPKGPPLTKPEIALLRDWINHGAPWGAAGKPKAKPPAVATKGMQGEAVDGSRLGLGRSSAPGAAPELVDVLLPPAAGGKVDFARDIHPLLQRNCARCHGPEKPKGRFRLDNRTSALKGGADGIAIIPGNSADSPLIHLVAAQEMPPKGESLRPAEVSLLRAWIDQGAEWGGVSDTPDFVLSISPAIQWFSVDGNDQKFREHTGIREGWTGGGQFTLENWIDPDTKFTAEGSVHSPANIDVTLALNRQDLGFVRGGVEQFRSYYNNYGGHYAPFTISEFKLDNELHLDTGRFWTEVGLRRPDWPEITLGYEYRFRDGTKSTLHWGPSTEGDETRNFYPAYKRINEDVHIIRADVKYDIAGLLFENNFMAEFLDLETQRYEVSPGSIGAIPDTFTTIKESHQSLQLSNTFSVLKMVKDWWLLSGGYYYSYIDADAAFQQSTVDGMGAVVFGQQWFAQPIVHNWSSNIFNVSTRLGPWEGLTFSAGVQNNWERQKSVGNSTLFFGVPDPMVPIPGFFVSRVNSNKLSVTTKEHASLRYDKIPYTVLFAEAELEQGNVDYFEQDSGVLQGFLRDSKSTSRDHDYRTGFTVSPWSRVSINSHYRYRHQVDDTDNERNLSGGVPNVGYPGFILGRELETHEFRTRLNFRAKPWLRTLLTYQMQTSDYRTETDSVTFGIPSDTVGGEHLAGEFDSDIFSLNVVATPWQRGALNGTFSFHDSKTSTASNADPAVVDYDGEIYSLLFGGSYQLGEKTHISAHYSFSRGDFSQGNYAAGLPVGIEYKQHALQAGIATQISENLSAQLQYQFLQYDEPTSGGVNDYTAHGIFLNCTLGWK